MARGNGFRDMRGYLGYLYTNGVILDEVFIIPTNVPGEPDLTGLRIAEIELDYVIFVRVGSAGVEAGTIAIPIDMIVAIEVFPG